MQSRNTMMTDVSKLLSGKNPAYRIHTYGCQMNEHDSERIEAMLREMGYHRAEDGERPSLVLFNTCCIREHAEQKAFGNIGALRKAKLQHPDMIIAVCGCMMQQPEAAQSLVKRFSFVDIVFGTSNTGEFPQMLERALREKAKIRSVRDETAPIDEELPDRNVKGRITAYLAVMYGCNNYCSYCIVPYVRGRERSRTPEKIIGEARGMIKSGVREIMLLGQNVNSYGYDLAARSLFPELIESIAALPGEFWLRFMTSHPKDLSDGLIEAIACSDKVCNQIHLPVQSGNNRILKEMNRNYTREKYLELIGRIRSRIPGVGLSTDIICGFPGETEEEFADSLSLLENVRFDSAYLFAYSPRKGTRAAGMGDQIPKEVKQRRLQRLIALQEQITREGDEASVGQTVRVLVDGKSSRNEGIVLGRAEMGRTVCMAGGEEMIGSFVNARIDGMKGHVRTGTIV